MSHEKSNKKLLEEAAKAGFPFFVSHEDGKCEEIVRNGRELEDVVRRHKRTPLVIVSEEEDQAVA